MAKTPILDVINNATVVDLEEIKKRRETIRKEDETLAVLEKALHYKFNGKPERAKPGTKKKAAATVPTIPSSNGEVGVDRISGYRHAMGTAIARNNFGAIKRVLLARAANVPDGSIDYALNHEWFIKSPEGVALSGVGKKRFAE